ncbi:kelch repeat-containing protein [Chloroflexota bacterium]
MRILYRWIVAIILVVIALAGLASDSTAQLKGPLEINLAFADLTLLGEDAGDWTAYFASPAGDVNGDGYDDVIVGAPMAGNKVCPNPNEDPCTGLAKGEGIAYLVLGKPKADWASPTLNLGDADASFLGCETASMTARQLYTAGDVNGDGLDDILISGWKCGENFTGKTYLVLGREEADWGTQYPVEQADASFLGEYEWDFASYYVATAGDVNDDGYDDFLISATHFENDTPCAPGTPAEDCGDCCKHFLDSAELYDSGTGTWSPTGNLDTDRIGHTSVLLDNGKVLAAGGQNLNSYLDSAELYDPATGTWSATDNLNTARSGHTATLLVNGQVLVVGGNNGSDLDSAELYNPGTGLWSNTDSMTTSRSGHTATLLNDGKVLVAGGKNGGSYINSTELYDPVAKTWTDLVGGDLNSARSNHTATLLSNGKVLVAAGENNISFLTSAELFDPTPQTWIYTGNLETDRAGHTATLLSDNSVLVAGGKNEDRYHNSAEIYDPGSKTWTTTAALKVERFNHTATLLSDGKVLLAGGQNDSGSRFNFELFDPVSETWTFDPLRPLSDARVDHNAVLLPDGRVLLVAGPSCVDTGKLYLILGREIADWGMDFDLANVDASFIGEAPGDRIGRANTTVGDVNGDGYDDFMIGSISSDYAAVDAGQNYLFLGRATPGDPRYDPGTPWWGNDFIISGADASFVGEAEGDEAGRRVARAGDVNGDGYSDIIIGAALNDAGGPDAGKAYLILGKPSGWQLHSPLAQADASFIGAEKRDQAGRRVSGAGDINNDGFDDFLIGAPHHDDPNEDGVDFRWAEGRAYLMYGKANPDWGNDYPLAEADVTYIGKPEVGAAGYDVAWIGNFDGDEFDDMLISAYGGRNNNEVSGEAYVVSGTNAPMPFDFLPDKSSGATNAWMRFSGDYWSFSGWEDIAEVYLDLLNPDDASMTVKVKYDATNDNIYLRKGDDSGWHAPCSPGDPFWLTDGIVDLDCLQSGPADNVNDQVLRVMWRVRWNLEITETQTFNVYLRAVSKSDHDSGYKQFGNWLMQKIYIYLPIMTR